MKKVKTKYIFLGIVIFLVIFFGIYLCPYFNIKNVNVFGNKYIKKEYIEEQLGLNDNTNLIFFNIFKAKKFLKQNNYIKNVKFKKILPKTLQVDIYERIVYGYVPYLTNYLYIDNEGRVLDVMTDYSEKLPIIYGLDFSYFNLGEKLNVKNKEALDIVIEFAKIMSEKKELNNVVKLDVTDVNDIHIYINEIDVIFGKFEDANIKINILIEVLKKLPGEEKGYLFLDDINKPPVFRYIT